MKLSSLGKCCNRPMEVEEYNAVEKNEKNDGDLEGADDGRERWGSEIEFILSTIGSVVGLGNLWRFPIKVKEYGGAVFLIPYFTMLLIEGVPLFLVEMFIGQKFRAGCIGGFYKIHKALSGIGFATWMIAFYTNLYYNAIVMYTIYYFFASMSKTLPWAKDCPEGELPPEACCNNNTKSQYYWYYKVNRLTNDINDAGSFNWELTLSLLAAWVTCFLCMLKGIKTSGKVVYVTAVFPFVALLGLFIMSMTLDGSSEGVKYFFVPSYKMSFLSQAQKDALDAENPWKNLWNPYCWLEAASQIFYSLSLGFGSCIAFASYNDPKTNFYKHAIGVSIVNSLSSMFAGITIFAILGYSAKQNMASIGSLSTGTGLAFISVSEAIAKIPAPQLWSALFFLMLFMLGIDSQFAGVEGMMTALDDTTLIPKRLHRTAIIGGFCAFSFLIGLPFGMQNGEYLVTLFDNFSANFPLMLVAFFEVISISWVYGINRFCADFKKMTGYYPNIIWRMLWLIITPISLLAILLYTLVDQLTNPIKYEAFVGCKASNLSNVNWTEERNYPVWAWIFAFFLMFSSFLFIPICAVITFLPKWFGPNYDYTLPLVAEHELKGLLPKPMKNDDVEMKEPAKA